MSVESHKHRIVHMVPATPGYWIGGGYDGTVEWADPVIAWVTVEHYPDSTFSNWDAWQSIEALTPERGSLNDLTWSCDDDAGETHRVVQTHQLPRYIDPETDLAEWLRAQGIDPWATKPVPVA